MSIKKITDLEFEREYATYGDRNGLDVLSFNQEGLEIDYDTMPWEDIKKAYKILFNTEIDQ